MKIQLAHFRNVLCTRNTTSKIGWKNKRARCVISQQLPADIHRDTSLSSVADGSSWFGCVNKESFSLLNAQNNLVAFFFFNHNTYWLIGPNNVDAL